MKIRKACIQDLDRVHQIGLATPEIKVSSEQDFMELTELKQAITDEHSLFLLAEEENKIAGFIHARIQDIEKPANDNTACMVYLVVVPEHRGKGIAFQLYSECEKQLKKQGVNYFYAWANAEGESAIIKFMKKQGFAEGHKYVWMDKKI